MINIKFVPILLFVLLATICDAAEMATLRVSVTTSSGSPMDETVILVRAPKTVEPPKTAVMDQIGRQFAPHVLPVYVGTAVNFPNKDQIKHHLYSFSTAKKFEIKLYSGNPPAPVVFNEVGEVALGCNIHDWMIGFIYVTDVPHFGKTDIDGKAELTEIPEGTWTVSVWSPRMKGAQTDYDQQVIFKAGQVSEATFSIPARRDRRSEPGY